MIEGENKKILGIKIASLTLNEVALKIINLISNSRDKKQIFYVNAHCLTLASQNPHYKKILNQAALVYSGGIGPVIASSLLGKPLKQRTPTPDFIDRVFRELEMKHLSIYFLGSKESAVKKTVDITKSKFPQLNIVGFHSGYFTQLEVKNIITEINHLKPTVLLVGMGSLKQETWIASNEKFLNVKVMWAVGALFDVISNTVPRAPKWIQVIDLEWMYRLFQEPLRLWKRYTFGNLQFLYLIFQELIKNNKY